MKKIFTLLLSLLVLLSTALHLSAEETTVRVYFDNTYSNWTTPYIHVWKNDNSGSLTTWTDGAHGAALKQLKADSKIYYYDIPTGYDRLLFNDNNSTQTDDIAFEAGHVYFYVADKSHGDRGAYPEKLYIVGNLKGGAWTPTAEATVASGAGVDGVYTWSGVEIAAAENDTNGYFSFIKTTGNSDWDATNKDERYVPNSTSDVTITLGEAATVMRCYPPSESNSNWYCVVVGNTTATEIGDTGNFKSYKVAAGTYNMVVDLTASTLTVTADDTNAIAEVGVDAEAVAEYYTLQGVRVAAPAQGLYIVKRGSRTEKVLVR